ncbi:hypothetical protein BVRB_005390 [Beta vulgaris subsp. vulgaris]|uniref:Myb/SANT-like domain-containing protein n=1 Tax=Beta vulgaris subsp. vulgaris TaxID=3555 RepID=A0A0J8B7H4_BETVV|nr:hypothetical protein BVRB_005390 [Beta vulgaris subsp. vulgaris]
MSDEVSIQESRKRARDNDEDLELVILVIGFIIVVAGAWYGQRYRVNEVTWNECERAQTRATWMNALRNNRICREQLRLDIRCFEKLCHTLQSKGDLMTTRNVTIKEIVALFLHVLAHDLKNRTMHALFAHSRETISRQFHVVLRSMPKIGKYYIKPVDQGISYDRDNKWKWFEGVLGALDRTHIDMTVPIEDRARYRDRKGDISTNVLASCDPNLRFTYVLPGWEGSASDPRVLRDALHRPNRLKVPRRTMNSKRQGKEPMGPPRKWGYFARNRQMDVILTSTLYEQINEGNKGDGDFKSQAYQAVVDKLRVELNIFVIVDHVRNRIRVWKRHYATIIEIRAYTKFKWDEEKKMLVIPLEVLDEWKKENPNASGYLNNCIDNWDDIVTLFALDRATSDGAEQHEESATAMDTEIEGGSTSKTSPGGSNKKLKRDRLADAVSSFTDSFKEYVSKAQDPPKPSSQVIYDVVSSVLGLSGQHVLQAVKRFMNGPVNEFDMLKHLPEEQKLDWILLCISD